ncbi:MAG: SGNH/GDSL hydrolase family protein [Prosthecobacter sp.]|uniref:SGNH/GDSL hydrolase family protein n=1 Tax=Prosthecobacter sp. TaxID=1965333 RepID=UPI003901EE7A
MKHIPFAATILLTCTAITHSWSQDLYDYKKPRESQNWTTISLKTKPANGPDLPLVLLIGDSITVRYAAEVGTELKGKAYDSLLGSSKAASDPALLDEIKLVLRQNVYSVIHFNFGLHGDVADVRTGLPDVIATIKRYAPNAKLIWATTTPCQQKDDVPDERVIEKNKAAAEHIQKADIAVDDLYALVAKHPAKLWDAGGVHYTAEGTAIQSKQVAQAITPLLPQ